MKKAGKKLRNSTSNRFNFIDIKMEGEKVNVKCGTEWFGEKVNVKCGSKWYPATILEQLNEEEVVVEFFDHDYDEPEIVSISDVLKVSSNSLSIKSTSIAGAFNRKRFESFVKDIMKDNYFVTPLSIDVDLKSSLLTVHASDRIEKRYRENMQEFHRSLKADQYLAFREIRKRVFSGCWRIDCTPDLKHFHSLQIEKSVDVIENRNLELVDISHLKNEVEAWSRYNAPDAVSPDLKSCKLFGDVVSNHVITTTTRFVLNEDLTCILTVIKFDKSFGNWRKKRSGLKKQHLS